MMCTLCMLNQARARLLSLFICIHYHYTELSVDCQEWIMAGKKTVLYSAVVWASGLWGEGWNVSAPQMCCAAHFCLCWQLKTKCFVFVWDYRMNVCLFAPEKYSHVLSYVRVWRLLFCRAYETLAQLLCDSLRCKKCCTNTNSLTYLAPLYSQAVSVLLCLWSHFGTTATALLLLSLYLMVWLISCK